MCGSSPMWVLSCFFKRKHFLRLKCLITLLPPSFSSVWVLSWFSNLWCLCKSIDLEIGITWVFVCSKLMWKGCVTGKGCVTSKIWRKTSYVNKTYSKQVSKNVKKEVSVLCFSQSTQSTASIQTSNDSIFCKIIAKYFDLKEIACFHELTALIVIRH